MADQGRDRAHPHCHGPGWGDYYAFTVATHRGRRILCNDDVRAALRMALNDVRRRMPFRIHALVLLPDHLHGIWCLPRGDAGHLRRWSAIKSRVTRAVGRRYFLRAWLASRPESPASGRIWARESWWQAVERPEQLRRWTDYVHWNPVGHGKVDAPGDWPYSTFRAGAGDDTGTPGAARPAGPPPPGALEPGFGELLARERE